MSGRPRSPEAINMACFELSRELEELEFTSSEAAPLARTLLRVVGRLVIDAGGPAADPAIWENTRDMALTWIDEAVRPFGRRLQPPAGSSDGF